MSLTAVGRGSHQRQDGESHRTCLQSLPAKVLRFPVSQGETALLARAAASSHRSLCSSEGLGPSSEAWLQPLHSSRTSVPGAAD